MNTATFAEFVAATPAADLPRKALDTARLAIADTIGVTLAGIDQDTAAIARRWVLSAGAQPVATILGTAEGASPAEAAFANGVAAHVLDFDDSLPSMRGHPSATLVPVILAVGQQARASGAEALAAYALALEIGGKLGRALGNEHYLRGWHSTATVGAFTATAAAARLWRLDPGQLATAWGIAASMAAGLVRNFGTMTKSFHTGHAARVGITAAWMAREGFTADADIFSGTGGFLATYGFGDGADPAQMADELGRVWEAERPGVFTKGWPCCYCNHRAVGGLIRLVAEERLAPHEIEEVAVGFAPGSDRALIRDNPQTGLEGKFSIEYAVAATLLDGAPGLESFTDAAVTRPEARALMARVRRYQVPAEGVYSGVIGFTDLAVIARGRRHERRIDVVPGSPDWPLSDAERQAKFLACATPALGAEGAARLFDLGAQLDGLDDLGSLVQAACPGAEPAQC